MNRLLSDPRRILCLVAISALFLFLATAEYALADYDVVISGAASASGGWSGASPDVWTPSAPGANVSSADIETRLNAGTPVIIDTTGGGAENGDIQLNSPVTWNNGSLLTLSARRNISINSSITATGAGQLGLRYGMGAIAAGNTATYNINAPVNLPAGSSLSTKLGSDGTAVSYTVITSLGLQGSISGTDLQGMAGNLSGNYALGADIDASETLTWNGGTGFNPVGVFSGTFDGLGHTINGLYINRSANNVGLFGQANGATIRNIGLTGVNISSGFGASQTGVLIGDNIGGSIANSYSTGTVQGTFYTGGLVGRNNAGTITGSYSTATVTGQTALGGLVGDVEPSGSISKSYFAGTVSGNGPYQGGIVGYNMGTISNCYNTGAITTGTTDGGGLSGFNVGSISNSYSTGSVSTPTVNVNSVGGLAGAGGGAVTNCYWDTTTSGRATSVGGGTGLTTAQMMQAGSLSGLGFTTPGDGNSSPTWWLSEGNTRPFLRSEYSTTITNAHQLQLMVMNLGASYTLANNINMVELTRASGMWDVSKGFVPVGNSATRFTGNFDGLGHTINGLTINLPTTDYVGLFGIIDQTGSIKNVGLTGVNIIGQSNVGGLLGSNNKGTITDSYTSGAIGGVNSVGGLAGENYGVIQTTYSLGSVTGTSNSAGGLVGYNDGQYLGSSTITNSFSIANVNGHNQVGGLIGYSNSGPITNNYSTGAVSGDGSSSYVGGLIGFVGIGSVTNNYASGVVSGITKVGGFIGQNNAATVSGGFWDITASGSSTGIAFGQNVGADQGSSPLTTTQMMQLSSFSGWNISSTGGSGAVWRIYAGHTYPLLKGFLKPLTITADNVTKTYDGAPYTSPLTNPGYSVAGAGSSGLLFNTANPYNSATSAGSYTPDIYSSQLGYDISYVNGVLTITALPNYTITIVKTGTGTVASTVPDTALNCGATCSASYAGGTNVTLFAISAPDSAFTGWGGACSGTGACTVTMDAAKAVTANFVADTSLSTTFSYDFNGLAGSNTYPYTDLNGQDGWTSQGFIYPDPAGFIMGVSASSGFDTTPALRFDDSGAGYGADASHKRTVPFAIPVIDGTTTKIVMQGDFQVGAWANVLRLAYDADSDGLIRQTNPSEIGPGLNIGTVPGITMLDAAGTATSVSLASLGLNGGDWVRLRLVIYPTANGGAGVGNVSYQSLTRGDSVLKPVLGLQNIAMGLDGSATGVINPAHWDSLYIHFEGSGNQLDNLLLATGTAPVYQLVVVKSGAGVVTADAGFITWNDAIGTAPYENGKQVTLTARPVAGGTFVGWSGEGCSGTGTCTVTMDAARSITATFSDIVANALHFDGSDDYVDVGSASAWDLPANFTMETWLRPESVSGQRAIFQNGTCDMGCPTTAFMVGSGDVGGCLNLGSSDSIVFQMTTDNAGLSYAVKQQTVPAVNQWTHAAVTYDGATLRLYINGILESSTAASGIPLGSSYRYIGADPDSYCGGVGRFLYQGMLREFSIWNRALSPAEIASSMGRTLTVDGESGLTAYYSFNQGIPGGDNTGVTSVLDTKGGQNGTLFNFALNGAASNWVWAYPLPSCSTLGLSSSGTSVGYGASTGSFTVATTPSLCDWTVMRSQGWLSITGVSYDTGTVSYAVAANTGGARSATITAGGQLFTVNQDSLPAVNGACGASTDGDFSILEPPVGLCAMGTPQMQEPDAANGKWRWNCSGLYGGTTASCSANIIKLPQTLIFTQPPATSDSTFYLTPYLSLSSGLIPTLGITTTGSAVAVANGSILKLSGTGDVTVTASHPGNAFYDPAAAVSRTFTVTGAASPVPPFGGLDASFYGNGAQPGVVTIANTVILTSARQPADGKIVVAGYTASNTLYLKRLHGDGTPDGTFAPAAFPYTNSGIKAKAVAVQGDGKILVAGTYTSAETRIFLLRYLADGSLDQGFGAGGAATYVPAGRGADAYAMAIDGSGNIVVSGESLFDAGCVSIHSMLLVRFTPSGQLDTAFGTAGAVTGADDTYGRSVALQPDGKIVVAGYNSVYDSFQGQLVSAALVWRFNQNGSPDDSQDDTPGITFGTDGVAAIQSNDSDKALNVAVMADGRIVLSGEGKLPAPSQQVAVVWRLTATGVLDDSFGTGGTAITYAVPNLYNFPDDAGGALAVRSDGSIIVGSYETTQPGAVVKGQALILSYKADGTLDSGFGAGGVAVYDRMAMPVGVVSPMGASAGDTRTIDLSSASPYVRKDQVYTVQIGAHQYSYTAVSFINMADVAAVLASQIVADYPATTSTGGVIAVSGGAGAGVEQITCSVRGHSFASSLMIQPDGGIVVTGLTYQSAYSYGFYYWDAPESFILRLVGLPLQSISGFVAGTATYGDAPITLSATASSGLPVSFSVVNGPGSISGSTLTITGVGTINLKASQSGSANYAAAPDVTADVAVAPRSLTVTADSKSKLYGAVDPALSWQITSGALTGSDAVSGALSRVAGENAGSYAIQRGSLTAGINYNLTFVPGTLTIAGFASQTITGFTPPATATYGDAPITLSATASSGLPVSFSVVSGNGVLSGANNATLTITGTGTITLKASQAGNTNYAAAPDVTATLTVEAQPLSITSATLVRGVYGSNYLQQLLTNGGQPPYNWSVTAGSLPTGLSLTGETISGTPTQAGSYNFTLQVKDSAASSATGSREFSVTIDKAMLTVTATSFTKPPGYANPDFIASHSGFVPGDTVSVLNGSPAFTTTATTESPVGSYDITIGQGTLSSPNYGFTFVNGILSVSELITGEDGRTIAPVELSASPGSQVTIAAGTLLTDASGKPVTGPFTMASTPMDSMAALPQQASAGHSGETSLVALGASIDLNLSAGGVKITKIDPPMVVKVAIPSAFAVPKTAVDYYSFDGTNWQWEGSADVKDDGTVDMQVPHLSIWAVAKFQKLPSGKIALNGTAADPVTVADALRALQIAVGMIQPSANDLAEGDVAPLVNGRPSPNKQINVGDAIVILQKSLGVVGW